MKDNLKKRIMTSFFLFLALLTIFVSKTVFVCSFLILGVFTVLEFFKIIDKAVKGTSFKLLLNLFFVIYVFLFCLFFVILSNNLQLKITLFSLMICCIGSDLGGYIIGKIFKGPKLTKISPKKTISGSVGSLIFANMFLIMIFLILTEQFNFQILIIASITSIFCQLGDLLFSYLKRRASMKDTGNFLPGHGGILDRIDGILFGIPLGFITILILNL